MGVFLRVKNWVVSRWNNLFSSSEEILPLRESTERLPAPPLTRFQTFKRISGISLPMALSYTFSFEVVLIIIFLNLLSENEEETASVALISTMMNSVLMFGISPLFAMGILASRYLGELRSLNQSSEGEAIQPLQQRTADECQGLVSAIFQQGLSMGAILAPPLIATLSFSKIILSDVFGQDPEVAQYAQNFLRPYSVVVPALMARVSAEQIMFSDGHAVPAMLIGLTDLSLGTLLAAWLGFGGLGVPSLGPIGVALGYVVEGYLTASLYNLYLVRSNAFKDYSFFNFCQHVKGSLQSFIEMLKLGAGISFSMFNQLATTLATSLFAGLLGAQAQSAWGAGLTYFYFASIMFMAFGAGCAQEVNREIGAKAYADANRIGKYGLLTTLLYVAPVPIFFAFDPGALMTILDLNEATLGPILARLLPIFAPLIISETVRYNLLLQLRPLKQNQTATLISFLGMLFGITVSGVLGLKTTLGIYGIALGYTGASLAGSATLLLPWLSEIRESRIKNVQEDPKPSSCFSAFFQSVRKCSSDGESNHLMLQLINS